MQGHTLSVVAQLRPGLSSEMPPEFLAEEAMAVEVRGCLVMRLSHSLRNANTESGAGVGEGEAPTRRALTPIWKSRVEGGISEAQETRRIPWILEKPERRKCGVLTLS